MRFAQVKNNKIVFLSSKEAENSIIVPEEFKNVSDKELITFYTVKNGKFSSPLIKKPLKDLKIALVSNYKQKCGISTYAEALWEQLIDKVGDYCFFIEENDTPTSPLHLLGEEKIPSDKIVSCWKRGAPFDKLIEKIKEYDPDIVLINHEWGIFDNARYFLGLLTQLSCYRVICTMHSTYYHQDKAIIEGAIPEIIVHLQGAKDVLQNVKKIAGKVNVIPHGFHSFKEQPKLWNFYKSEQTLIQLGFGFRYKRFELTIKALSYIKDKYPNVFLTCLFSTSPFNLIEHQNYYNELLELTSSLNLEKNVALIKGFQSDAMIDCYLRMNKVAVFPYGVNDPNHEVFGASGAARLAISKGIPTISSNIYHFSDLPTIKADSAEEIAKYLDLLFSDKKQIEKQVIKQLDYLNNNTWDKVADMYCSIFEN